MPFNISNREKVDGSWGFVDLDGQPITDETLLAGWSATFESSSPAVVAIADLESNPASVLGKTFTSGVVGSSVITSVLSGPNGESFTGTETINVINSAPGQPVFTFGQARTEG